MPAHLEDLVRRVRAVSTRRGRAVAAGVATLAVATAGLTALAPAAQSTGTITATSVTLGASSVQVRGLAVGHVTVTVGATIDTAQITATEPLVARLARTSAQPGEAAPRFLWALLPRTGGADAAHGTYSGRLDVPSTADGTWVVDQVLTNIFGVGTNVGDPFTTDPRADGVPARTLTVVGTHRPVLTLVQTPVIPYPRPAGATRYTLTGTVVWSDTKTPVSGLAVTVDHDVACLDGPGTPTLTTNAAGTFRRTLSTADGIFCVTTPLRGAAAGHLLASFYHRVIGSPLYAVRVSAAMSPTVVPLGAQSSVTGSVAGLFRGTPLPEVRLQKLVGRRWVTVNTAQVRASGRYTLAARPGARGTFTYRVWLPTQRPYAGTTTGPVRLTVR